MLDIIFHTVQRFEILIWQEKDAVRYEPPINFGNCDSMRT